MLSVNTSIAYFDSLYVFFSLLLLYNERVRGLRIFPQFFLVFLHHTTTALSLAPHCLYLCCELLSATYNCILHARHITLSTPIMHPIHSLNLWEGKCDVIDFKGNFLHRFTLGWPWPHFRCWLLLIVWFFYYSQTHYFYIFVLLCSKPYSRCYLRYHERINCKNQQWAVLEQCKLNFCLSSLRFPHGSARVEVTNVIHQKVSIHHARVCVCNDAIMMMMNF